jgi:hypothetical protein
MFHELFKDYKILKKYSENEFSPKNVESRN